MSKERGTYSFWFRLVVFLAMIAMLNFVVVVPLGNLFDKMGLTFNGMYAPKAPIDILSMVAHQILRPMMILAATYLMFKYFEKESMKVLRISFYKGWFKDLGYGLMVGIGLVGIMFVLFLVFGWTDIIGLSWKINGLSTYIYGLIYIILAMASVAVTEELFIRGYLFYLGRKAYGLVSTFIVTSIVFGLMHLMNPTGTSWGIYVIPITLSLAGGLFAQSMISRNSLWTPIGLHFAWNTFLYGVFNLNGGRKSILFVTEIEGPAVFVGIPNTSFGPEVSVLGAGVMILGILIFMKMKKVEDLKVE